MFGSPSMFGAAKHRPTLLIHAGNHKTGTTALQRWLDSGPPALTTRGIVYPRAAAGHWQHSAIIHAVQADDQHTLGRLLNAVAEEAGRNHLILSTEWFQYLSHDQTTALVGAMAAMFPGHDIASILYIRRQDELFDSMYNQKVKYGTFAGDFLEFFEENAGLGDYDRQVATWTALVGAARFRLRLYDRATMARQGTIQDFCAATGLIYEPQASGPALENRSLPANLFALKRRMNRYIGLSGDEYLRVLAAILSDVARDTGQGEAVATTRMERAYVMAQFEHGNRRLFDRSFKGVDVFRSKEDALPTLPAAPEFSLDTLASLFVHVTQYFEHTIKAR